MEREHPGQALALSELTRQWAQSAQAPSARLLEHTSQALAAVKPSDLPHAQTLVSILGDLLGQSPSSLSAHQLLVSLLDSVRRRRFAQALSPALCPAWTALVISIIDRIHFTVPALLTSREQTDPDVVALRVLDPEPCELTVAELARRTRAIARGLLSVLDDSPQATVALLSENCLPSTLCDIACLTNGIVNVRVAGNSTSAQVEYILRHSKAQLLLVSDEEQWLKVQPALASLPLLRSVVLLSPSAAERHGLLSLEQLIAQGADIDDSIRQRRASLVRGQDLATVMYTSGTTGEPKGIMFSHRNLVTKRFCRGFALPNLGEGDVFLSYLPLYHTFGRWLELLGTLYWGATYVFARSPARGSLIEDFRSQRPTVFISVPKKWLELQEQAVREAGTEHPAAVAEKVQELTGGRLRQGLSAAGYLDPVVFHSMAKAGIDLCSGYGMTEATGGITMTPPGHYRDGSIGKALPGIDLMIAPDGELLIQGPYVMLGYLDPPDGRSGLTDEGWFSTGDIVACDADGYYRIVDRKKEIYKNRKGQTIAPQRIENLFRDMDAVGQAFLVGDQREYNTLLLYPNYERHPELGACSSDELRVLLGSLVVSANRFLAPFERVVAFRVLPRQLSEQHGELTPKGTFRRLAVEEKWRELIEPMYQEHDVTFALGPCTFRIPNWLLREMGSLRGNLSLSGGVLSALDRRLTVRAEGQEPPAIRVGDFVYRSSDPELDLGALLSRPSLWLGNDELRRFLGDEAFLSILFRARAWSKGPELISDLAPEPSPERASQLTSAVETPEVTADSIHAAAVLLSSGAASALSAIKHLERGLAHGRSELAPLCRSLLRRLAKTEHEEVRRWAFRALLPGESPSELLSTLELFLEKDGLGFLGDEGLQSLCERGIPDSHVQQITHFLASLVQAGPQTEPHAPSEKLLRSLIRLIGAYAVINAQWYARVRYALAHLTMHPDSWIVAQAEEELDRVQLGFRARIGPNLRLAVDPETRKEYGWAQVVVFDDEVPPQHRQALLKAITETSLVRESVFLFGKGTLLTLADIPPAGLWVSHLGTKHGKSVYRLSLQTRVRGAFDMALNLADSMSLSELREEIRWLLAVGASPPIVEEFGGYYAEHNIFTEEFIPGETVEHQVARLAKLKAFDRLKNHWPFLVWNALGAHIAFWDRSGRSLAMTRPAPGNVIIPSHDYQVGARLVSISDRSPCESVQELLTRFAQSFLLPLESSYPLLKESISPVILLSAFVETLGIQRAVALLSQSPAGPYQSAVQGFLLGLEQRGYTPQRLYFAAQRYGRWLAVNPQATVEARGDMLQQLWDTYGLQLLEEHYPDTRIRFFRQTVFKQAREHVAAELDKLMHVARDKPLSDAMLRQQVDAIRATVQPSPEEDYFWARLTFRHLRPSDDASFISTAAGAMRLADVVVNLHDTEGERFQVRSPLSAREVAKLLHIFHGANLVVTFSPEHEFLLALDSYDQVVGGLYYRMLAEDRAYLEKIVVARPHRKKGISDGLMHEFMRRLQSRGVRSLATGFFRPEYMMRFGFRTEPRYSGLVRDLSAGLVQRESKNASHAQE